MHNLEPFLVNETHKILWDLAIQTDHLFPARRPDLVIPNKKKREPAELWTLKTKESKNGDKYLDLARELKKTI